MNTKISFEQPKNDHLDWLDKMKKYLNGVVELNEQEIVSHLHSKLGRWFYTEGKVQFGNLKPMKAFELKNITLHQFAKELFENKNSGTNQSFKELLENIENTSKEIILLINETENMINEANTQDELNIQPVDKLLEWDKSKILVLKTDTLGKIEYANQAFLDVSGYESIDILDKPFDIVRHPDMTVTVQKWVLVEIMQGIEANVIVKCLAKSGKYFWALLDYKINMKADGTIANVTIKFQGLNMSVVNNHIIPLYKQLYLIEKNKGLEAGKKYLRGFLEERNRTFDEFTRNLISTGRDSFNDSKSNFFKRIFGLN